MITGRLQRTLAGLLLALSATVAMFRFGAAMGVAAWIGQLSVGGALLVLLLSWRPRLALSFAALAFGLGAVLLMF